jgi:hypothetical protein
MLERIQKCVYKREIDALRALRARGDQAGYDLGKKKLPCFTPSGMFLGGRMMQFLVKYTGYVVLDMDKLPADILQSIKAIIMLCTYTLACFISPSGNGLKVLVKVSTGAEDHLNAYLSLQRFYSVLTGVKIDPSGKDITRLCFVSADPDLYYNPDATVYEPLSGAAQSWPADNPIGPKGKKAAAAGKPTPTIDVNKLYHRAIANVERHHTYVEGERNEFDYALARQMQKLGVPESSTLELLLRDYNFNDQEVRASIKSAYGNNLPLKPKKGKKAMPPSVQADPTAAAPPDQPPPGSQNKSSRELYNIMDVEWYLNQWIETRYNIITGVIEWRKAGTHDLFIWMKDKHEHTWFCDLHKKGQLIPISTLHILLNSDFSPDFNPFVDYFHRLKKWDGKTNYIGQLCDTVKTLDDVYWNFSFLKWFVAYVASMIVDDIFNHTVVVLVGAQGAGKTTWMKRLVPKVLQDFLGTTAMQADSKDAAIQLSECGLIILDELENLNRKDLAMFKELITRPKSRIRRPYGRNSESMAHLASFIAGVNHEQILTDISGTRRYLCSNIVSIDYQHKVDIDKCMAQAYALFQSGFRFWFNQDEIKELTMHNEDFLSKSVEEELISTWFVKVTREEWKNRFKFADSQSYMLLSSTDIAIKLMEKARFNLLDSSIIKIGRIMKSMEFIRMRQEDKRVYIVRLLDNEAVVKASHSFEETPEQIVEREANEQIIRFEEDLFTSSGGDGLPF